MTPNACPRSQMVSGAWDYSAKRFLRVSSKSKTREFGSVGEGGSRFGSRCHLAWRFQFLIFTASIANNVAGT